MTKDIRNREFTEFSPETKSEPVNEIEDIKETVNEPILQWDITYFIGFQQPEDGDIRIDLAPSRFTNDNIFDEIIKKRPALKPIKHTLRLIGYRQVNKADFTKDRR